MRLYDCELCKALQDADFIVHKPISPISYIYVYDFTAPFICAKINLQMYIVKKGYFLLSSDIYYTAHGR